MRIVPTTVLAIQLLFVGTVVFFVPLQVSAQEYGLVGGGTAPGDATYFPDFPVDPNAGTAEAVQEAQAAQQRIAADSGVTKKPSWLTKELYELVSGVMTTIMQLFAWLAGVAMLTLEYAMYYTVVQMGPLIQSLGAVGETWAIFRDLGNIILIFGFLAIGITTILNVDWYGKATKMLPMLLIVAVFLNFSLFITSAIVDTGNLFATQFYKSIVGGTVPTELSFGNAATAGSRGVAGKIMNKLGLQTIYGDLQNEQVARNVLDKGNPFLIGFMSILLFIVLAFVLFSLAFVLIARFIILLFLIIIAPVGFVGLAVPQLESKAKQWWDMLFKQTLTAPILLLLLYVALRVITSDQFPVGGRGNWLGTTNAHDLPGFGSVLLSFLIAMGLLIAVVIASKELSAFGAGAAMKMGGKLSFGLTAAGLRSTAGWGLQAASRRFRSSKLARVPILGRTFAGALDRGAKASFDVRGVKLGGGLGALGIDAGKAQEGGYRKQMEEAIKGREDYAKTLTGRAQTQKGKDAIVAAGKKLKEAEDKNTEAQTRQDTAAQERDNQKTEVDRLKKLDKESRDKGTPDLEVANELRASEQKLANDEAAVGAAEADLKKATGDLAAKRREETKVQADVKIATSAEAAQKAYAKNLEIMPWGILYRNSKAAENIRKNAEKTPEARQIDALMELLKKQSASAETPKPSEGGEEKKP